LFVKLLFFFLNEETIPEDVHIYTNFFQLVSRPNWTLYQYHVDFEPALLSMRLKYGIVHSCKELFPGGSAFDGSTLFSTSKLVDDTTVKIIPLKNDIQCRVTFLKVAIIYPTETNLEFDRLISIEEEHKIRLSARKVEGDEPIISRDKRNDFIRMLNIVFKKLVFFFN
jgi:hypothetical protein